MTKKDLLLPKIGQNLAFLNFFFKDFSAKKVKKCKKWVTPSQRHVFYFILYTLSLTPTFYFIESIYFF